MSRCGIRTGKGITVALRKGTVPFSSNENWDSPPRIDSPALSGQTGRFRFFVALVGAWLLTSSLSSLALAQGGGGRHSVAPSGGERREGPSDYYRGKTPPPAPPLMTFHGGQYLATDAHEFEMVFLPLQARIYVYDKSLKPQNARDLHVRMSLQLPDERKPRQYPFLYAALPTGSASQDYVVAAFDFSLLKHKETPITLDFSDLPDRKHPTASFSPMFTRNKIRPYVAQVAATKADAAAILRQRVCPVSGDVFGSRGPVVKLLIGDFPLFVCCEDCIAAVRESPARYLPHP